MPDTFHPYARLPPELQQMVWQHYRQDRGVLRHYFRLSRSGRYHAAYNVATGEFERVTARTTTDALRDPLDPAAAKIRFTGRVQSVLPNGHAEPTVAARRRATAIYVALGWGRTGAHPRSVTATHAWVNFADDIFIFENAGYRRPGKLRFLARGIHSSRSLPPPPGAWPAHIRTLALYLNSAPLDPFDHDIFRTMDGLRTLLLVSAPCGTCMPPAVLELEQATGYVDAERIVEHHQRHHVPNVPNAARPPTCFGCCLSWQQSVQDMEQLMQLLGRGGVKVKLVFDCRQRAIPCF